MSRSASAIIEGYLSQLRSQLEAAGAGDVDEQIAEIRAYLLEAAGDDPDAAVAEVDRLGGPGELARGMLVEAGLDGAAGMPTSTWWRMGIAAPVDILIGLSVPIASAAPLLVLLRIGEPRGAAVLLTLSLAVVVLVWPLLVWRPWQQGGRSLSPGMTLAGIAVVRAPGFWQVVRVDELDSMGLAPRRRMGAAAILAVFAVVLLASVMLLSFGALTFWHIG